MIVRPFVPRTCLLSLILGFVLIGTGAACRGPGLHREAAPTQSDRLMAAYPDLRGGRFAVIADFEDPKQMEILQLISVSPKAKCVLSQRHGRAETGGGCVQFTAGSPDDAIVLNNDRAVNWYLKRNWRDWDLLLFGIESPRHDLTAEITISAGPTKHPMAVHSSLRLERGWNLARLDLAEVGERIPLDDVRDIRFSVSGARKPVKLNLDDIILAGSQEDLFGDSHSRNGALYVRRAGRRWNIGAGGQFELTFANGQIVRWHNLKADPYRVRNLVQGTTLGPSLLVTGSAGEPPTDFTAFGSKVLARSRILEMNSVRVVVACEWRFVDGLDAPRDDRPFHRWVYTIYSTGQIYVAVDSTSTSTVASAPPLGLTVTMAVDRDGDIQTHLEPVRTTPDPQAISARRDAEPRTQVGSDRSSTMAAAVSDTPPRPYYAFARSEQADAFLLYVPGDQQRLLGLAEESHADRRRVSFTAQHRRTAANTEAWHCHMLVGAPADISDDEALARAIDYARPGLLRFELGSPVLRAGGSDGRTGFDPTSGCFAIKPDQGRVRFMIDGRRQPRFSPVFQIIGGVDTDAWVYVNHLIFENLARDATGNLVFQLPGTVRGETVVEVLFRRRPATANRP